MSPKACSQRPILVRELSANLIDNQKLDQKRPSRAVSFDVDVKVFPVPHIHDFDEHQIDEIWWNPEDFRRFKANCKQIVRSMNREELDTTSSFAVFLNEEQDICTRGLERFSASQCQVRAVRRFEATEAVLMEQSLQRDEDSYDPEYISTLYQKIAASSQVEANRAARLYQREAFRVSISRKAFFRRRGFTHIKKKSLHPEFETFLEEE